MRWYHYLEGILPIYILGVLTYGGLNATQIFGLSTTQYAVWITLAVIFVLVFFVITYYTVGTDDFRFKLYFHVVVFGIGLGFTVLQIKGTGFLDILEQKKDVGKTLLQATFVNLMAGVFILGPLMAIMDLVTPLTDEINNLSKQLNEGKEITELSNPKLVNDKILGPPVLFLHNTLKALQSTQLKAKQLADEILQKSEDMLKDTQDINATIEEAASVASSIADGTAQQAEYLGSIISYLNEANAVLNKIIKEIQENAHFVSEIAVKTNILALNAGIEASRAGDYGRGFGVVAENIRKLSDESQSSAEEIEKIVKDISNELKQLFDQVQNKVQNAASISEETAASAEEVSSSIKEIEMQTQHNVEQARQMAELAKSNQKQFSTKVLDLN